MVNKLRKRVVLYTVASVVLVLALLMGAINAVNFVDKDNRADEILLYLAENGGDFPKHKDHAPMGEGGDEFRPPRDMTEQTPFDPIADAEGLIRVTPELVQQMIGLLQPMLETMIPQLIQQLHLR